MHRLHRCLKSDISLINFHYKEFRTLDTKSYQKEKYIKNLEIYSDSELEEDEINSTPDLVGFGNL